MIEERVGEDDPPRVVESGQSRVGFLAFLRKIPLVHATHPRSGTLTECYKARLELRILERLEFVKNRKKNHGKELLPQHNQPHERYPCDQPPILGELTHNRVEQLDNNGRQPRAHQKPLGLIPYPCSQLQVG